MRTEIQQLLLRNKVLAVRRNEKRKGRSLRIRLLRHQYDDFAYPRRRGLLHTVHLPDSVLVVAPGGVQESINIGFARRGRGEIRLVHGRELWLLRWCHSVGRLRRWS